MFSFPFSSQQGPIFIALFNYEQRTSEDLTFKKGDKLEIINSQVLTHALCVWREEGRGGSEGEWHREGYWVRTWWQQLQRM